LGLHVQAYTIYDNRWSDGGSSSDWRTNVDQNIPWIASKGYNCILLDVMDSYNGTYHFECDLLKSKGYSAATNALGYIVEQAHRNNITVYGDITVLAWRLSDSQTEKYHILGEKLTISEVQQVAAQLLDNFGLDGLISESYPLSYSEGIANEVHNHSGKVWIHKCDDPTNTADIFMAEDYVGFISSQAHLEKMNAGSVGGGLAADNVIYSHAQAAGKPGWVKVTMEEFDLPLGASHNVLLLRAVQFQTDGFFWMPKKEVTRNLVRDDHPAIDASKLIPLLTKMQHQPEQKKVANLVISLPWYGSPGKYSDDQAQETSYKFMEHAFGPVSNGLMLAGYDIVTTYNEVLPDADVYVVFAIGETQGIVVDAYPEVDEVIQTEKPAVFVVWGVTNNGNWKNIVGQFGISENWQYSSASQGIGEVTFNGQNIPWSPTPFAGYQIQTSIIPLDAVDSGTVLLSTTGTSPSALITQKGTRYLINANALHLQTSFIFSQLFSSSLKEPFYGIGALGTRSCFMAMQDTNLVIDLPFNNGQTVHQILFGSNGAIIDDKITNLTKPLRAQLKQYELLIVEPA
jgi:hypothetical protein